MTISPRSRLRQLVRSHSRFPGTARYWEARYASGGNSGAGSYGEYASGKAKIVNRFLAEVGATSVVEFGCGDGHQLTMLAIEEYIGLDVAPTAIEFCKDRFNNDGSKSFFVYSPRHHLDRTGVFRQDAALSQEVLFHLIEEEIYHLHLEHLFGSAKKAVIICAADIDLQPSRHEHYRRFLPWIEDHAPAWVLREHVLSPWPYDPVTGEGFLADFYLFVPRHVASGS